ncbi:MAG: hypothetical protein GVY18_01855 [Bacteroidetes bacterium]|jgi:hypothetical protein|nr:hypothetical protein [Bacteroidota bacterium]
MFRQDVLMRQVQQLTQALAQVIFRVRQREFDEALQMIQQAGQEALGLDLTAAHTLHADDVAEALDVESDPGIEQAHLVAELLYWQGRSFEEQDADGLAELADRSYALALRTYLDTPPDALDLHHGEYVDALRRRVDLTALPDDVQRTLVRYLEALGRFAAAEDVLFELAEAPSPAVRDAGLAFYDRLLALPDDRLDAGGLPRAEVQEGRAAFQARCETT